MGTHRQGPSVARRAVQWSVRRRSPGGVQWRVVVGSHGRRRGTGRRSPPAGPGPPGRAGTAGGRPRTRWRSLPCARCCPGDAPRPARSPRGTTLQGRRPATARSRRRRAAPAHSRPAAARTAASPSRAAHRDPRPSPPTTTRSRCRSPPAGGPSRGRRSAPAAPSPARPASRRRRGLGWPRGRDPGWPRCRDPRRRQPPARSCLPGGWTRPGTRRPGPGPRRGCPRAATRLDRRAVRPGRAPRPGAQG